MAVALAAAPAGLSAAAAGVAVTPSDVVASGNNNLGQLGTGTATESHTTVQVSGLTGGSNGVTVVAPGELFALALRADASVVAWGSNYSGQLGDGTQRDRYSPVSVSGVGGNGTLSGIGCPASAPSSCVPLVAGDAHVLALRPDGSVLAWGNDDYGQLGDGGTLARSTPEQIMPPGSGVVAIAAGSVHSLALKADGTVLAWGGDGKGQLGNGTTTPTKDANPTPVQVTGLGAGSGVTAIGAGVLHSIALKGGSVLAWGENTFGQLGDGTACTFNPPAGCVDSSTPVTVAGLSGVTAISAGGNHNLALSGGTVYSWGSNFDDEIGRGAAFSGFRDPAATPVVGVGGSGTLTGITAIAAAELGLSNLAIRSDGSVVSWGLNDHGQLGDGTTTKQSAPVVMTGVSGARAVSAGYWASYVLQPNAGTTQSAPAAPSFPQPAAITKPSPQPESGQTPPTNVAATTGAIVTYATPVVAADPTHPGHLAIAFADGSLTSCYLSQSSDGGKTWSPRTLVGSPGQYPFPPSVSDPTQKMDGCWSPNVAYGPEGNLYYEYNGIDPASEAYSNLFLMVSTDGGATFRGPQQVNPHEPPSTDPTFNGGDQNAFSAPGIAVDTSNGPSRGQLYVAYYRSGPSFSGQVRLTACTPNELNTFAGGGALACNASTQVDAGDRAFAFLISLPVVGADGTVSVVWMGQTAALFSDVSNPSLVQVASSSDHGATFGDASTVDASYNMCPGFSDCFGGQGGPQSLHLSTAAGPHPGDLYVAVGARRGEGFTRSAVSVSHDNGSSWSSRVEIGRIAGQLDHGQHSPQVAVAPNGQITVVYYDTAPDFSENLYLTSSADGGATYSAPQRISTAASNLNIMTSGFPVADEVAGLVATNGGPYIAWTDSRRGTTDNLKTDIEFATTVSSSGAQGTTFPLVAVPATGAATDAHAAGAAEVPLLAGGAALIAMSRRLRSRARQLRETRRRRGGRI